MGDGEGVGRNKKDQEDGKKNADSVFMKRKGNEKLEKKRRRNVPSKGYR